MLFLFLENLAMGQQESGSFVMPKICYVSLYIPSMLDCIFRNPV